MKLLIMKKETLRAMLRAVNGWQSLVVSASNLEFVYEGDDVEAEHNDKKAESESITVDGVEDTAEIVYELTKEGWYDCHIWTDRQQGSLSADKRNFMIQIAHRDNFKIYRFQ